MRAFAVLCFALLLAGCTTPDDTGADDAQDGQDAASTAPGRSTAVTCTPGELLSWTSDQNPADEAFVIQPGTATMDVAWTEPTATTRAYSAILRDPSGGEVFVREKGEGVSAGSSSISTGNSRSTQSIQTPPPTGEYRFTFVSEGVVEGGALTITATCG